MKIEHIAIWVKDLENMKTFYQRYFSAQAGDRYENPAKGFASYFLSFDSGARLEIMSRDDVPDSKDDPLKQATGYIHLAMSVGSKQSVNTITSQLAGEGYAVLDGPRTTGDGYYESVVLDPENNRIEITE